MGDDSGTGIFERLPAGDVVEVVMAVNQVSDRPVGDFPDFGDVGSASLRSAVRHRIGGDDSVAGDEEHRLVIAVAEDVNVVGAVDFGRRNLWRLRRLTL